MNKIVIFISFIVLFSLDIFAQNVGINSDGSNPDNSAGLDVNFSDKGMLIPRVDIGDLSTEDPISNPATSLIVYNTNTSTGPGYFYWDGSKWVKLFDEDDGKPWLLGGNGGTTPGTDFLGTTDTKDLVLKTNSTERVRITSGGFVGINTNPSYLFDIDGGSAADDTIARITGNSLTSGTGLHIYSNSLTSGKLVRIEVDNSAATGSADTNMSLYVSNNCPYANAIRVDAVGRPNYSAIFAISNPATDGSGFSVSTSNHTLHASLKGNKAYSFAVFGRIVNAPNPSGGVIGYYATDDFGILGYWNGGKTGVVGVGGVTSFSTLSGGSGGAFSSDNVGVYGYGDTTSSSVGGYFNSDADDGMGVIALGNYWGVYAESNYQDNNGYCAVLAMNDDDNGTGVIGLGSNTNTYGSSGYGDGINGTTDNSSGHGVGGYYYDGSDIDRFGTLGSSSYGVYGHYSSNSFGYLAGSSTGLYSYGSQANSIYAAEIDPGNSSNAVVLFTGDDSDPIIRCNGNNYGRLGTSNYHWYDVYSYYLHYHAASTFDTYDDLKLIDDMVKNAKIYWDPALKHHIMIMDKNDLPDCIAERDENGNKNGFIDAGKTFGLTTGAIRQLNHEAKDRDKILTERTEILADAIGVNFKKLKEKDVEVTVNDFGSSKTSNNKIHVEFSDDFKKKISDNPVVVITPASPYKTFYITNINKNGFDLVVEKQSKIFEFNWVAYAKIKLNKSANEHIDNPFYERSFKISGDYPILKRNDNKGKISMDLNLKIKPEVKLEKVDKNSAKRKHVITKIPDTKEKK